MVNQLSKEFSHGFGQTLVKPGQTWSNLLKLIKILLSSKRGLGLTDFHMFGYF
jgi:hypothetical protein